MNKMTKEIFFSLYREYVEKKDEKYYYSFDETERQFTQRINRNKLIGLRLVLDGLIEESNQFEISNLVARINISGKYYPKEFEKLFI